MVTRLILSSRVRARPRARAPLILALALVAAMLPGPTAAETAPYRVRAYEFGDVCPDGLPWTADAPLVVPGPKPRDEQGVPMYRVDGRLYYRPGALAINGMKRIDAYEDSGDEAQLAQALKQAARLRRMTLERRGASWLPFWYDYLPAGQRAPWFNAMTQGLVLSFYIRLHHVTGEALHLSAADGVFSSFLRLGQKREPWVSTVDRRGFLWLEHYPLTRPDHVLNAHLHAIFGIYEYWQATRSPTARKVLNGAVTTLRKNADRYRRPGGVSLYGLRTRSLNVKYHEIHVWQLNLLSRITGDPYFSRLAGKLRDDRRPRGHVNGRPARHGPGIVGPQCRPEPAVADQQPMQGTSPTPSSRPA